MKKKNNVILKDVRQKTVNRLENAELAMTGSARCSDYTNAYILTFYVVLLQCNKLVNCHLKGYHTPFMLYTGKYVMPILRVRSWQGNVGLKQVRWILGGVPTKNLYVHSFTRVLGIQILHSAR